MIIKTKDGVALNIITCGSGKPIFMLHGNLQQSRAFKHQIAYLKHAYKLVLIDTRGHGLSEHGNKQLTLQLLAQDLIEIADELKIERFSIIGYSDGANIALNAAMLVPECIISMVLISPNLNPAALRLPYRILVKIITTALIPFRRFKTVSKFREKLNLANASYELIHEVLTMPAMIITGSRDLIHKHHLESIASYLTCAEIVIIPRTGHAVLKNSHLNAILKTFLDTQLNQEVIWMKTKK